MADKLKRVTKANVGPRDNVGGPLNNALVTVQDHNKVIDAVNLLIDDDNVETLGIVEVIKATAASQTTDFGNVKVGDTVVRLSDGTKAGDKDSADTAGTCPIASVAADEIFFILRAV